jgi:hypothetical protein
MKKFVGILFILMLTLCSQALDVSGNQSGVWSLANSPYNVTGDITIPLDSSLEIEEGVEVLFSGDYQITALGRIIALGNQDSMITFKASSDDTSVSHQGIRLEFEGQDPNLFDYCFFQNAENGINSINSPVNITNSHFTYNDEAIHVFAIGNTNPPAVHIEGNLIENSVKSGILIAESSNVMIINNEITGNGTGPQFRGAIQVSIQTTGMPVTPTITENNIHNNHYQGITCVDMFSSNGINAQIFDNIIAENYTGVYFYNCSGTLYDNQIINNHIEGDMNSGAGIMCYGGGATPYIAGNLISGNYGGIYLTVGAQPVIGAPEMNHPYAYGLNTIQDNIDVNGANNSVILNNINSSINILAKNNYWGTSDVSEIAETIFDSNDNPSLGTVVYLPIASENDEYTLSVNITSELTEQVSYSLRIRDLNSMEMTDYHLDSIEQSYEIVFENPITFTIIGYYELDGQYYFGHCYYGPFDEQTIISLNDDNQNEEISLNFNAEAREKVFKTYENIEVNGNDVTPILKDEFFTEEVKQLVYENDNNELMLVGYQKYGPSGWETVTFDQEYLYLKNDAQIGETFANHQVTFIDGSYNLYSNACEVLGSYGGDIAGQEIAVKVLMKILDSPWDMETSTMNEYTGDISPLSVNPRVTEYSDFYASINSYTENLNQEKLLNLQENTEIAYQTESHLLYPSNLRLVGDILMWNPCSSDVEDSPTQSFEGYSIAWENESEPNMVYYHDLQLNQTQYPLTSLTLAAGESSLWLVGRYEDGSYTDSSNSLLINIVSNDVSDLSAITQLAGNYPNPFNPETRIKYSLKASQNVSIIIYNIKGQKVRTLIDQVQESGNHSVVWNGRDDKNKAVTSGIYFYKMKSGKYSSSKKMILLK